MGVRTASVRFFFGVLESSMSFCVGPVMDSSGSWLLASSEGLVMSILSIGFLDIRFDACTLEAVGWPWMSLVASEVARLFFGRRTGLSPDSDPISCAFLFLLFATEYGFLETGSWTVKSVACKRAERRMLMVESLC